MRDFTKTMDLAKGSYLQYPQGTARPTGYRGLRFEIFRCICRLYLWITGWKMAGDWPSFPKAVLLAAPHTSNWDAVAMVAVSGYYRIRLRWIGKASLVAGPFGWIVRWAGCVPVDRAGGQDNVAAMVTAFAATDELILAVAPEGTRNRTGKWKSGFYQIALQAKVPIIIAVPDYGRMVCSIAAALIPSGDYAADLALILPNYVGARGKRAGQFSVDSAN
jgi:1-acyl-sn-glycerol-3-phosphate acyltransferase